MNIGNAAQASGVPAKTIRYYEDIGLIHPARSPNGYRDFSRDDAARLAFLGRARALGFSIEDCRSLLDLQQDNGRASADVKRLAQQHIDRICRKIEELNAMRATLEQLADRCQGNEQPDCAILDGLARGGAGERGG